MKRCSTIILRLAVIIVAIVILILCCGGTLRVIMTLGSNLNHNIIMIVMLVGLYLTVIPFYCMLYQTIKLLGYIDSNLAFSQLSVQALKKIKLCAIATIVVCTLGGLPFLYQWAEMDDAPGLIIIGLAISGGAFVIAVFASVLKRLLQEAIKIKSENDLTI